MYIMYFTFVYVLNLNDSTFFLGATFLLVAASLQHFALPAGVGSLPENYANLDDWWKLAVSMSNEIFVSCILVLLQMFFPKNQGVNLEHLYLNKK